jgi:hypothetical protein
MIVPPIACLNALATSPRSTYRFPPWERGLCNINGGRLKIAVLQCRVKGKPNAAAIPFGDTFAAADRLDAEAFQIKLKSLSVDASEYSAIDTSARKVCFRHIEMRMQRQIPSRSHHAAYSANALLEKRLSASAVCLQLLTAVLGNCGYRPPACRKLRWRTGI